MHIAALVRNENHVASISAMFPRVRIVRGSLDDRDILIEESSKAKIVMRAYHILCISPPKNQFLNQRLKANWFDVKEMATDHEEGLLSIIEGLRNKDERDYGYLIHTSDTSVLIDKDFALGEYDKKLYDDIADVDMIKERLSKRPGGSETMIMNAAAENTAERRTVRTAIICPSAVYGFGKGPISKRGGKLTALMKATLLYKSAFKVENGKNVWSVIDIDNLAEAYVRLVEKALRSVYVNEGQWDSEGYYVAETEELVSMAPKFAQWPAYYQVLG